MNRRAFLTAIAAIPAATFMPRTERPTDFTPIIFGDVPREWLELPYLRAIDGNPPRMKLITSYDQDTALRT